MSAKQSGNPMVELPSNCLFDETKCSRPACYHDVGKGSHQDPDSKLLYCSSRCNSRHKQCDGCGSMVSVNMVIDPDTFNLFHENHAPARDDDHPYVKTSIFGLRNMLMRTVEANLQRRLGIKEEPKDEKQGDVGEPTKKLAAAITTSPPPNSSLVAAF